MIGSVHDVARVAYPLNVFLHVLLREEGRVEALHYGLFDTPDEPILVAQERSTALLIDRLPAPPARLLDVGSGLGTLLHRLRAMGYEAEGLTPDVQQAALSRVPVACARFEDFAEAGRSDAVMSGRFDAVIFQESSQYIDPKALWQKASRLTTRVLVLDEFLLQLQPTAEASAHNLQPADAGTHHLRPLTDFVACAARAGFSVIEERDLSAQAAPTVDYFLTRIPRHRDALVRDLGVSDPQLADLLASGTRYRELYRTGVYGYRLLDFAT
jgi:hypothetical protein